MASPTDHKVFVIQNNANGNFLSLPENNWTQTKPEARNVDYFKQLWLLVDAKRRDQTGADLFHLHCLGPGMNLQSAVGLSGSSTSSSYVTGGPSSIDPKMAYNNQLWSFVSSGTGYNQYYVKNAETGGYLDTFSNDGESWGGCTTPANTLSQCWSFERRSRSSAEIEAVLKQYTWIDPGSFRHYAADGAYINLPYEVRQSIWNASGMDKNKKYRWRSEVFDCDDFAVNMKAEVAKWAYDNIKADHVSVLMGMIWGNAADGGHAFNWFLTPDLQRILLYEPQEGKEENPSNGEVTGMNLQNYRCYFGLY